jgi:hypothetical protein
MGGEATDERRCQHDGQNLQRLYGGWVKLTFLQQSTST